MASSGKQQEEEMKVVGEKAGVSSCVLEKGAKILQSLTPVRQFQQVHIHTYCHVSDAEREVKSVRCVKYWWQHVSTWAMYGHDMNRRIETHHFASRLNEDCLQCAVFDSDESDARLIGVEYIIADRLFLALPEEEQKLWHSHAFEVKQGLWVSPGVPEAMQKLELKKIAKTYGKFWCTWQVDRGDKVPMGVPALMMSPQEQPPGQVPEEAVRRRDSKYGVSSADLARSRAEMEGPQAGSHEMADYWKRSGKGFVVELEEVTM